jgi:hypothetical protein
MADKYFFPADATTWASFTDKVLFVPRGTSNAEIVETFTIPTTLVYQGPAPLEGTLPVVTVGGAARTVTETTPSAGQVQIDRATGEWTFNAADSGGTASVTMTPYVTWVSGEFLERLQDLTAKPSSTDNAIARFNGTSGDLQDSGVTIDDSDNLTTTGDIEAADISSTGSGGVTANNAPLTATGTGTGFNCYRYGGTPAFNGFRANGSVDTPTAIGSGNELCRFQFVGYNGTDFQVGARMVATGTETHTPSQRGTSFDFMTVDNGSTTLERKFGTTDEGISVLEAITLLTPRAATSLPNNSFFLDSGNSNKLSFKDNSGTTQEIAFV